jgi:hypothetical protein
MSFSPALVGTSRDAGPIDAGSMHMGQSRLSVPETRAQSMDGIKHPAVRLGQLWSAIKTVRCHIWSTTSLWASSHHTWACQWRTHLCTLQY